MFKKFINISKKAILARSLLRRGICLKHGTKRINDRSEGLMGYGGVIAGRMVCLTCEEEARERREETNISYEDETKAMWEEYNRL